MILYYKPTCPYCQRVLETAKELGVTFQLKDVVSEPENREELLALGGKMQVPFLVDDEKGVKMYESGDIIDYLRSSSEGGEIKPRIHKSVTGGVCD